MNRIHHVSEQIARANFARERMLLAETDGDVTDWRIRRLLHVASARRPICHADALAGFAAVTDGNPALVRVLKILGDGCKAVPGDPAGTALSS